MFSRKGYKNVLSITNGKNNKKNKMFKNQIKNLFYKYKDIILIRLEHTITQIKTAV
jgi:hypothetical protein